MIHLMTFYKIYKVIEGVAKLSDAIKTIKSDVSGIPEIKGSVDDLLHRVNEMANNVENVQAMRDDLKKLSRIVEEQNKQIHSAQERMLLFANQVDESQDEVECHKRNEQRFCAHENSRFSFIKRRLNWIMTRLDIPQPQPDE